MRPSRLALFFAFSIRVFCIPMRDNSRAAQGLSTDYARDPAQPIDQHYTDQMRKYTTDPAFTSPLVDYLPASKTVPTPDKVLGDVSGAPDMLPYAEDVYKYFRLLEASSPRVKVFTIGHSEEGREMIAAAIADPEILAKAKENSARLAKLGDPRTINFDDAKARELISQSYPVYYITGTIHSPETGAPTALMELAYRLAVDDAPYIKYIRSHMIVLITPVVEVDGRDRMVDIYKWHKANPGKDWPRLLYWGHYVAHDNNRDAMAHDPRPHPQRPRHLHRLARAGAARPPRVRAVPLRQHRRRRPLQRLGRSHCSPTNGPSSAGTTSPRCKASACPASSPTATSIPGAPAISCSSPACTTASAASTRPSATEAQTPKSASSIPRNIRAPGIARTRPTPSSPGRSATTITTSRARCSSTISYFSHHTQHFLDNYYLKSKRSVQKPTLEGPAAYVIPADATNTNRQVELLKVLKRQHVELQVSVCSGHQQTCRLRSAATSPSPKPSPPAASSSAWTSPTPAPPTLCSTSNTGRPTIRRSIPTTTPDGPSRQLFNVKTVRITDPAILKAEMTPLDDPATLAGKLSGSGIVCSPSPTTARSRCSAPSTSSKAQKSKSPRKPSTPTASTSPPARCSSPEHRTTQIDATLKSLSLDAIAPRRRAIGRDPRRHRTAHRLHAHLARDPDRRLVALCLRHRGQFPTTTSAPRPSPKRTTSARKYDVIIFAPVGRASSLDILNGTPTWNNAMPWQKTELTPNLGAIDSTADMRPGLGLDGLAHLKSFVEQGGLLITCEDTAQFAIDNGLALGVSVASAGDARVVGSVLNTVFVAPNNPVAFGYGASVPVISASGLAFNISNTINRASGRVLMDPYSERPTGRGSVDDGDEPQGRKAVEAEPLVKQQPWEAKAAQRGTDPQQSSRHPAAIPARRHPALLRREDHAALRPARQGILDRRTRHRRRRPPRRRQRAALRQQPHLSRRNHRQTMRWSSTPSSTTSTWRMRRRSRRRRSVSDHAHQSRLSLGEQHEPTSGISGCLRCSPRSLSPGYIC